LVKNVRVSTISFKGNSGDGPLEDRVERNRRAALLLVEKAALDRPDIVCLPETFTGLGLGMEEWFKTAETAPGPTTRAVAEVAKRHGMNVVCPIVERTGGRTYNSAILIDRAGEIVGAYHKIHPTIGEIEAGITPGTDPVILQTDFGPVGFAICFDLNFRDVGEGLKAKGAKLVLFPSMYPGGLQLSVWAHDMSFYMASAFTGSGSAIVDPLGRVLVRSSDYMPIISKAINLDYEVLHIDSNNRMWDEMKAKYGSGAEIDVATPEAVFVLYSNADGVTANDMVREFKLETRDDYFGRANAVRRKAL
jgi:predicted amidohydrolase